MQIQRKFAVISAKRMEMGYWLRMLHVYPRKQIKFQVSNLYLFSDYHGQYIRSSHFTRNSLSLLKKYIRLQSNDFSIII